MASRLRMSSWKWFLLTFLGGGIVFWIPDLVIPALDPSEQRGLVTIASPVVLILFYAAVLRLRRGQPSGPSTAIFAMCGMWLLAVWFTTLAQTVRGSGFKALRLPEDLAYLLLWSLLPWRIIEAVMLEGSAIALALGTVAMLYCHAAYEEHRWILPPSVWTRPNHANNN
jgi:hypothetical protein